MIRVIYDNIEKRYKLEKVKFGFITTSVAIDYDKTYTRLIWSKKEIDTLLDINDNLVRNKLKANELTEKIEQGYTKLEFISLLKDLDKINRYPDLIVDPKIMLTLIEDGSTDAKTLSVLYGMVGKINNALIKVEV